MASSTLIPFKLTQDHERNTFTNCRAHPSDLVLAQLCEQVTKYREIGTNIHLTLQDGITEEWTVLRNAIKEIPLFQRLFATGYIGAAFYNAEYSNIVIAFKGTSPKTNYGDFFKEIAEDLRIGSGRIPRNLITAYEFARTIFDDLHKSVLSICLTGHSLGGFFASTSAIYLKHSRFLQHRESSLTSYHVHTVVFDCPGSKYILEKHFSRQQLRHDLRYFNDLDLTCYLLKPNLINSWNDQLGTLLYLPEGGFHYISDIIAALRTQTDKIEILDWPYGGMETFRTRWIKRFGSIVDERELKNVIPFHFQQLPRQYCEITLFNEDERQFLNTMYSIIEQYGGAPDADLLRFVEFENMSALLKLFNAFSVNHSTGSVCLRNGQDPGTHTIEQFITVVKCLNWNRSKMVELLTPLLFQSGSRIEIREVQNNETTSKLFEIENILLDHFSGKRTEVSASSVIHIETNTDSTFIPATYIYHIVNKTARSQRKRFAMVNTQRFSTLIKFLFETPNSLPSLDVLLVECYNNNDQQRDWLAAMSELVRYRHSPERLVLLLSSSQHPSSSKRSTAVTEIITIDDEENHLLPFIFSDLTLQSQKVVRNSTRLILQRKEVFTTNGLPSFVTELLDSEALQLIHAGQPIRIGKPVEAMDLFEKQYYMDRTFRKIYVQVDQMYADLQRKQDTFLVFGGTIPATVTSAQVFNGLTEQNVVQFILSGLQIALLVEGTCANHKVIFQNVCAAALNETIKGVHWLQHDDENPGEFIWQMSQGDVSRIPIASNDLLNYKYRVKGWPNPSYTENEILHFPNNLVLLIDEPGMGKSTSMRQLVLKTKVSDQEKWVIFIDLNAHGNLLTRFTGDIESLVEIFCKLEGVRNPSFGSRLLTKYFSLPEKLVIFMDGFDEIDKESGDQAILVCKFLLKTKAKVYLASRSHCQHLLQTKLGALSHQLNKFNMQERREYFLKYWTHHTEFIDENYPTTKNDFQEAMTKFVNYLLKDIEYISDAEFIGVPLQLFMFAIIYFGDFLNFCSKYASGELGTVDTITNATVEFKQIADMLRLYDLFTNKKFELCLYEKCNYPVLAKWDHRELTRAYKLLHRRAALQYIYPVDKFQRISHWAGDLDPMDWDKLKSIGIIKMDPSLIHSTEMSNPAYSPFIHRSMAEYFVADLIAQRIRSTNLRIETLKFLQEVGDDGVPRFFQPEFDKIRYFLDHILIYEQPLDFHNCLLDAIRWRSFNSEIQIPQINNEDELGRTIVHYAACYGNYENGILGILLQNRELLTKPDSFGFFFMDYMLISKEFIHAAALKMEELVQLYADTELEKLQLMKFGHPMENMLKCILMNEKYRFLYWFIGDYRLTELQACIPIKAIELIQSLGWTDEILQNESELNNYLINMSEGWSYCLELLTARNYLRGDVVKDGLSIYERRVQPKPNC